MSSTKRFTVGQEVVIDPRCGAQEAAVVTKVARKYLTVESDTMSGRTRTREFDMTTSRLKGWQYGGDRIFTREEWDEERLDRAERKRHERHREFLRSRLDRLPRAELARLNDLLDELNPQQVTP